MTRKFLEKVANFGVYRTKDWLYTATQSVNGKVYIYRVDWRLEAIGAAQQGDYKLVGIIGGR